MEQLFEALSLAADGAYIIDDRQRIIFWNKSATFLLGYDADEVVGRQCYQIFGGRDDQGWAICRRNCVPFAHSTHAKQVPNFDTVVPTKAGEKRWFNVSIIPILDDDGQPWAVLHLFRDIQAKKQAEAFAMQVASQARQLEVTSPGASGNAEDMGALGNLTPREDEILRMLARGVDTEGIATELMISRTTVRNHIQHILHKLGVHSRVEAIAYIHRRKVIDLE